MFVGYITEPLHEIRPEKFKSLTAIRVVQEAKKRGHEVCYFNMDGLCFQEGEVYAKVYDIEIDLKRPQPPHYTISNERTINLKELDILFIRKDPPINEEYITCSYLFELLEKDVFLLNNPRAVRSSHSKLLTLRYPQYIAPTLVCFHKDHVLRFLDKYKDIILKPLSGLGGQGILRLKEGDKNTNSLIDTMFMAYDGQLMAQKYLPEAETEGDKRIILFDGKPYGAILRTPAAGDFRSNITAGGSFVKSELTEREKEICEHLGPYLREQGLFFVGLDIIGGYITEINATSPGAIGPANKSYGIKFEEIFWDVLEAKLAQSPKAKTISGV